VSKDAKVASAISHWAARFVSNGVLARRLEEVTGSLERWKIGAKPGAWRARMHEDLGRKSLQEGYRLTAGEHLIRAAIYYHFAKFVFVQDPKQMRAAHMRAVECYRERAADDAAAGRAGRHRFSGHKLFGVLRKPEESSCP